MSDWGAQTDVFAAVAAPARRAMIDRLSRQEMPVMELAESFEMTLSAVSQHLGVLRNAGLVSVRKSGKQRYYRLNPEPLKELADWAKTYESFWTEKLNDLGTYLEKNP